MIAYHVLTAVRNRPRHDIYYASFQSLILEKTVNEILLIRAILQSCVFYFGYELLIDLFSFFVVVSIPKKNMFCEAEIR